MGRELSYVLSCRSWQVLLCTSFQIWQILCPCIQLARILPVVAESFPRSACFFSMAMPLSSDLAAFQACHYATASQYSMHYIFSLYKHGWPYCLWLHTILACVQYISYKTWRNSYCVTLNWPNHVWNWPCEWIYSQGQRLIFSATSQFILKFRPRYKVHFKLSKYQDGGTKCTPSKDSITSIKYKQSWQKLAPFVSPYFLASESTCGATSLIMHRAL